MKILSLTTELVAKWDLYVENHAESNVYQISFWNQIIKNQFGWTPHYMLAIDGENIKGVLPLFQMLDILGKKYLISIPFSNFAGILVDNNAAKEELLKEALKLATQLKAKYVELRQQGTPIVDVQPIREQFVTMHLYLDRDPEKVWKEKLNTKSRNQTRKALKNGLEFNLNESVDNFYKVYSQNMRDLGSPPYPIGFFKRQQELFNEKARVFSVYHRGKIIAVLFSLGWKGIFSDPYASSLREYNHLSPNNLLYWKAIEYACLNGYSIFDMGRSTVGNNTYRFKKQWGAQPVPLYYQYILNGGKIPVADSEHNKYELAIKIWKKLPLKIATLLGNRIIKYLPEI